jgi:rod shape determining protein RodA
VGCVILIFLFVMMIVQIFRIADRARDSFSALVAVGVGGFFLFHFIINISMVLGVFPVVGVPLSFMSYGGTHMVTALSCIGIVIAVERKRYLSTTSF